MPSCGYTISISGITRQQNLAFFFSSTLYCLNLISHFLIKWLKLNNYRVRLILLDMKLTGKYTCIVEIQSSNKKSNRRYGNLLLAVIAFRFRSFCL